MPVKQLSLFNQPKAWEPHAYQRRALRFILEHHSAGLWIDPGLGKTSITLAALKVLKDKGLFRKALIVAPLRVCYNVWPAEVEQWTDFHGLSYVVLHGPNKDRDVLKKVDLYIINYEGLPWLLDPETTINERTGEKKVTVDVTRFKKFGFDVLVADELSKFKHIRSQRFRMLKNLLPTFQRRWGLTGSPAANGLLDLFGQVYILDNGRTFGKYLTRFRAQYFASVDFYQRQWVLRSGAAQAIYEKLGPLVIRMSAEEYGNLPPLVEQRIRVELPPATRTIYEKLEQRMFAVIENKTVTAVNAAVVATKCHQVANGGVFVDTDIMELGLPISRMQREFVQLHDEKTNALADLIDEIQGAPLLVAYEFQHDLARLKAKFGQDVPHLGGGVSAVRSEEIIKAWNRGELPLLFGHPQSIGHGVNLQSGGCHVAWYSLTYNYELFDQFIRRLWRQGQRASSVFAYYLLARNTVDEAIMEALRRKKSTQEGLFTALTQYREQKLGLR